LGAGVSEALGHWRRRLLPRSEPEVLIVSYPKCGRTWLRAMVGRALCREFDLPERRLLKTHELSRAAGIAPTRFVHDGDGGAAGIPWHRRDRDKSRFRSRRVALLVRDPRDVVVSSYFQATRRMGVFDGTLAEFLRDDCFGVRGIAAFYADWEASREIPREFLLLRYEDLHRVPGDRLRSLLAFMGAPGVTPDRIADAVAFASFDRLRALEAEGGLSPKLRPADPEDPDSFKVRRGVVGGHRDYLDADDLAFISEALRAEGFPFGFGAEAG
jgi:hypothetical protein